VLQLGHLWAYRETTVYSALLGAFELLIVFIFLSMRFLLGVVIACASIWGASVCALCCLVFKIRFSLPTRQEARVPGTGMGKEKEGAKTLLAQGYGFSGCPLRTATAVVISGGTILGETMLN